MNRRYAAFVTATLVVVLAVAHAPELAGWLSCNPLPGFSGLGVGPSVPLLGGQCFIDGNVGMTTQALGHLVAEDWLRLRLPWWNPYAGVGMPLAAEMQPAAFFLPFVLLLHFASGVLLLKLAMQMLAGLFMVACLRTLGIGRSASLCGGVLYALNGTFAWFGDAPILPLPFLPMLVYGIERSRSLAQAGRSGGWLAVAGGLGLSLLAGFPETAFVDGVLALAWSGLALTDLQGGARRRFAGKILAGGVCGLCVSAPAVVPFLDGLTRETVMFHALVFNNRLEGGQAASLLLPTVFGPPYFDLALGPWGQAGGYLGVGIVLPAAYALVSMPNRRALRWLLAGWGVFWFAVFLHAPVAYAIWRAAPVLNQVEVTRYAMPSIEFGWTVLACLALDDWRRNGALPGARWVSILFAGLLAAAIAAVLYGRAGMSLGLGDFHFAWPSLIWAVSVGLALIWLLSWRPTMERGLVAGGLMIADSLVSFVVPSLAGVAPMAIDKRPVAYLHAKAGLSRTYSLGRALAPNYGSYFGIATVKAFYEPLPSAWADYLGRLDPRVNLWLATLGGLPPPTTMFLQNMAAFETAGVRYVLVANDDPLLPQAAAAHGLREVLQSPSGRIYELPSPTPYFQVIEGSCRLDVQDRQDVMADCPAPAVLRRLELADPGWRASADARKLPIGRTGEIFQQVALPAGRSHVHFVYAPPYSRLIAALFGCGVLLALGPAMRAVRRMPNRRIGVSTSV